MSFSMPIADLPRDRRGLPRGKLYNLYRAVDRVRYIKMYVGLGLGEM